MRARPALLAALVAALLVYPAAARWYTEWLWFGEVGYRTVFWVPFLSSAAVAAAAALSVFLILYLNARPLLRLRPIARVVELRPVGGTRTYRRIVGGLSPGRLAAMLAAVVAILAALSAADSWPVFQTFLHQVPFGVRDPVFGRDVAFYVFALPAYEAVYGWLFGWLFVALLGSAAAYYLDLVPLAIRGVWAVPRGVRVHLSVLAGLLVLLRGAGFWLDRFGILYSPHGAVYGAGYADLHATLPALTLLAALSAVTGVLLLASTRARTIRPAVAALVVLLAVWIGGTVFYPAFVQQVEVAPNELDREQPYIRNGIASTLRAYGLDRVEEQSFPATLSLTPAAVESNRTVLDSVRLWDYRPLLRTYAQLQSLRLYYTFTDVGIDRYRINGREQQVMLSARELDVERLPDQARTWVNEHLVFTHGFGLVMTPVNRISAEGLPEFYIKDIPPQSTIGLTVARPQLYYSLLTTPYVVVNTRNKELDYAQGEQNVYATYAGRGGVPLTAPLSRLAFASRFGHMSLLLTNDITPQSRVLFHRDVRDRVSRVAPFLKLDRDPYLVLADGRLFWILDGYTTTSRYPYARPTGGLNYIRNSVKAVVDAYDGTVDLYAIAPADPLLETYGRIYPGLLKPFSAMPPALAAHVRYPVDLFTIQSDVYATFHMKDPRVFYNREDLWGIPTELFGGSPQPVEPYYVNLKLDPARGEEFALILPFTPSGKDNMVAWMAARSDPPNYGRLLVYRFPKDTTVFGPMQIEARINQDPTISAQLTLWNQMGSQVIRGNLLVVPIGDSLLYIEPLYLQAQGSALPELKRVIVAYGAQIAMEPTLDGAVARIFGAMPAASAPQPPSGPPASAVPSAPGAPPKVPAGRGAESAQVASLVAEANAHYARAQAALRAGDFATYGKEIDALGRALTELRRITGTP
ncbi:MAG TPA: UPF0182 family protein [bacterium]|nr:UPF0182 family protein [bacterium]